MNVDWTSWGPPLAVLALGLTGGMLTAMRLQPPAEEQADVALAGLRADLEQARAEALSALRNLELERDKLTDEEYQSQRSHLLAEGAKVLRRLEGMRQADPNEEARALLEQQRAVLGDAAVDAALAALGGKTAPPAIAPAWQGALWTLLAAVLVGVLWTTLRGDAVTRGEGASMTGNQVVEGPGAQPEQAPRQSTAAHPWQARLEEDPNDVEALNALTEIAIGEQDLATAMSMNMRAREVAPADPDARVFFAFLRYAIGQGDLAMAELESVVTDNPTHAKAYVYQGLLAVALERPAVAIPALEKAIALGAPGKEELEMALARARGMGAGGAATPTPVPSAAASGDTLVAGTITLDPGVASTLTGTEILYVSLRSPEGGPPLAALKLPPGPFPVAFTVGPRDLISMGGAPRPVPDTMNLSVRIDRDGNPMTRGDNEPAFSKVGVTRGTTGLQADLQ